MAHSTAPAGLDDEPTEERGSSRRGADTVWVLGLAVLAMALSVIGVLNGPSLSALDEHTHLDYAWKISNGELPAAGSELSEFTREQWSCRGQANLDSLPECSVAEQAPGTHFPAQGQNYNYWHPPVYYAITGAAAEMAAALPLGLTFATAARLTGGLWLAAAVAGMYGVMRLWRLPRWLAAGAAASLLGVPSIAHAASTVTNDAPAALMGVGALWALTRVVVQQRLGWLLPTMLAIAAASTKLMSAVAILVVAGVVGLSAIAAWRAGRRTETWQRLGVAAGPVLGVGAVAVGWTAFQDARAEAGWQSPNTGVNTEEFSGQPFDEWAPTLTQGFGLDDFWLQPSLSSLEITGWAAILGVLFTAAPFIALAAIRPGRRARLLGWAALVGPIAVPLLVQGQEALSGRYFPYVTSRYGMTLIPLTIAALAVFVRDRPLRGLAAAVPVVGYVVVLLSFAGVL